MNAELQEKGWSVDAHGLSPEVWNLLVQKKNEYLQVATREVQSAFGVSFDRFDSDKAEAIELAKAITRGLLRYDISSFGLAKAVLKRLKENYGLADELNYLALPYPIIHFSYDTSEIGPKHKDGYDYIDHFYTTWTPLNDCFHKPISVTEKTHRRDGFLLRQLRARLKFIDRMILASKTVIFPDLPMGKFLVWHGNTDHEGLLNTTKDITTTLVIRFTSSPILYDIALSCDDLEKAELKEEMPDPVFFTRKMISVFREIDGLARKEEAAPASFDDLLAGVRRQISGWELSGAEWKRLAFMLGLWAQRLEAKREVFFFYFFAFLGAHDNFYVLHKCITAILRLYGKEATQKFIHFVIENYPSRQLNHVIKSAISLAGEKAAGIRIDYPETFNFLAYEFE